MSAADGGDMLPDAVLAVVDQAPAGFRNNAAVRVRVHVAPLNLFDVIWKQLHAVRIHAAQIRRHQCIGDQASFGARECERLPATAWPRRVSSSAVMTGMRIYQHIVAGR